MKDLDITEAKAIALVNKFCKDLELSPCRIWFVDIEDKDTLGWYSERCNIFAYIIVEKYWSRRLVLVLHELTHHLQEEHYSKIDSPHGQSFQLAKSRVATWTRKNINDHFDWESLLTQYTIGRNMKWKTKKKKKS